MVLLFGEEQVTIYPVPASYQFPGSTEQRVAYRKNSTGKEPENHEISSVISHIFMVHAWAASIFDGLIYVLSKSLFVFFLDSFYCIGKKVLAHILTLHQSFKRFNIMLNLNHFGSTRTVILFLCVH